MCCIAASEHELHVSMTTSITPLHVQVLKLDHNKELRWQGKLWGSNLFFVGEHYRVVPRAEPYRYCNECVMSQVFKK